MRRSRLALAAGALIAVVSSARADDATVDRVWDDVSGSLRAGWRFLHDEEEGRFLQDRSLTDGPRIFDADVRIEDATGERPGWFEAEAHGVGDPEQSYRVRGGERGLWDLAWGFDRDDFSYRATGDPFPYDTVRERTDVRFRVTPTKQLTVRFDWDRSLRRGDAWVGVDTDLRDSPPPGVDRDLAQEHRPLSQQSDRLTLGVDARLGGGFRASLSESVRVAQIDDTRLYDIPRARSGTTPVREAFRRDVRSPAWTTVAKAGWTSDDAAWDVEAIFAYTLQDVDTDLDARSRGFDTTFDPISGDQRGAFRGTTTGRNDVDRDAVDTRVEATWRPAQAWELTAGAEHETVVDDASLRLVQRRRFDSGIDPTTTTRALDARIVNRLDRASLEAQWEVTDDVRLRVGEEYLRENLRVPTDSRGADFFRTNFSSTTWRTIAGADWEPAKGLDLSLLVKRAMNNEPHAATSADVADEISWRGRWKASDTLSLTTVYRRKGYRQDDDFDSAARSDSYSVGGTWTRDALTVSPNVTYQVVDARTDTTFLDFSTGSFRPLRDKISFETRDLLVSLDTRYAFARNVRGFLTTTWIDSRGDYEARWDDATLGGEYDLRENVTLGAALRSWRLNEQGTSRDDYRALGLEVWVVLRF
jgi:hypothetical protein